MINLSLNELKLIAQNQLANQNQIQNMKNKN